MPLSLPQLFSLPGTLFPDLFFSRTLLRCYLLQEASSAFPEAKLVTNFPMFPQHYVKMVIIIHIEWRCNFCHHLLLLFSRWVVSDFCDPMDYSLLTSSVHGISQARILERIAVSSSRGSSQPRIKPASLLSSALASEFFTTSAPWEALESRWFCRKLNLSVTEDLGGIIYFSLQIIYLKITADGDCGHEIKKTLTPWKESCDQWVLYMF